MSELADLIKRIAKSQVPVQTYLCKVTSIDKTENTIDVKPVNGNAAMLEIRLRSVIDGNDTGLIVYPAKGSFVLVSIIENEINEAFVSMYGEVESFAWKIGNSTLKVDNTVTEFNGGKNKGIPNVQPLTQQLNKIENLLNAVIVSFNTHLHTSAAPGQPTTPPVTSITQSLQVTQQNQIEDTKITH